MFIAINNTRLCFKSNGFAILILESGHTHKLDVPDGTGQDEMYLPGADYHQYVEIAEQGKLSSWYLHIEDGMSMRKG